MSDDGEHNGWTANRQSAVELLQMKIARVRAKRSLNADDVVAVELPFRAWELLIESAVDGQHSGKGRPADTHGDQLRKDAIIAWARERRTELVATGLKATGANSAEDQAAEEARVFAVERYGINIAASTIKRRMQSGI